jgi:hypothetical protein
MVTTRSAQICPCQVMHLHFPFEAKDLQFDVAIEAEVAIRNRTYTFSK